MEQKLTLKSPFKRENIVPIIHRVTTTCDGTRGVVTGVTRSGNLPTTMKCLDCNEIVFFDFEGAEFMLQALTHIYE